MPEEASIDSVIAEAINARVQASVLAALSGDEVIGQYVAAALNQKVTVKSGYRDHKVPFISHLIEQAIQKVVKASVEELLTGEVETIRNEVRKALKRAVPAMADSLVQSLSDAAEKTYGVNVTLKMPNRDC